MSFASAEFLFFGPLVYLAYLAFGYRRPTLFVSLASIVFYAYHELYYLPLLFASALIDFVAARRIHEAESDRGRKGWLLASIAVNIGILGFFKYWNFAAGNLGGAVGRDFWIHDFALPLGLSFYTLQTLSYTFDVYRRKTVPERDFGIYFLYVSFFPQLVAGPIERSRRLLPQLKALSRPTRDDFARGCVMIAWGLFVKLAVADNLAPLSAAAIQQPALGLLLWPVGILVMFQVYCDFMAYTTIARGLGRALGVELSENFRQPIFARTLAGFWQRWHITLTRWVVDYVHIPLARRFPAEPGRSLVAIGALCLIGFWHGATWNFLLFGLFHGICLRLWSPVGSVLGRALPRRGRDIGSRAALFAVLAFSAPMFVLRDLPLLTDVLAAMLTFAADPAALAAAQGKVRFLFGVALLAIVLAVDYLRMVEARPFRRPPDGREAAFLAALLTALTVLFGNFDGVPFVYFEF